MAQTRVGLYWFNNDLRLHDQPALVSASNLVGELVCLYNVDQDWYRPTRFGDRRIGVKRETFLQQGLIDLSDRLDELGQQLWITKGYAVQIVSQLLVDAGITDVFRSDNAGWYENQTWRKLQQRHPDVQFHSAATHTLFSAESLPFEINELPLSFSKFRIAMERVEPEPPIQEVRYLPPLPATMVALRQARPQTPLDCAPFDGGEQAGLQHADAFFASSAPQRYKQVRNELEGWENSTKLSPWLANGSLSVRHVLTKLRDHEVQHGANESTYWIYFELLWREYFQWYAHKHGSRLFTLHGVSKLKPLNSYYPERFIKWVRGTTPWPLVNACMLELAETGYLSNRGRQIVASCFVNELALDWRYGAAYFEKALLDYDVASNWGNWQYLAGVGPSARGKPHFNLARQTEQYDPKGHYIERWQGAQSTEPLDSVDAADWPIS